MFVDEKVLLFDELNFFAIFLQLCVLARYCAGIIDRKRRILLMFSFCVLPLHQVSSLNRVLNLLKLILALLVLTIFGEKASYFGWRMLVIGRVLMGETFTRRKLIAEN